MADTEFLTFLSIYYNQKYFVNSMDILMESQMLLSYCELISGNLVGKLSSDELVTSYPFVHHHKIALFFIYS